MSLQIMVTTIHLMMIMAEHAIEMLCMNKYLSQLETQE